MKKVISRDKSFNEWSEYISDSVKNKKKAKSKKEKSKSKAEKPSKCYIQFNKL